MAEGNTDANGICVFTVERGTYSWNVSKPEYVSKSGEVTVTEDITITVILSTEKYQVTIIVKDAAGIPISNAKVIIN